MAGPKVSVIRRFPLYVLHCGLTFYKVAISAAANFVQAVRDSTPGGAAVVELALQARHVHLAEVTADGAGGGPIEGSAGGGAGPPGRTVDVTQQTLSRE